MRLHPLASSCHVVGVHQVTLHESIHALSGGVFLGGLGARHHVGCQCQARTLDSAVPDLREAGVVRKHEFDVAVSARTQEAGFDGAGSEPFAQVVGDPRLTEVMHERPPVVRKDHVLLVVEGIDRGVVALPVAVPTAEQPGERHQVGMQVRRDFESHGVSVSGKETPRIQGTPELNTGWDKSSGEPGAK